MIRSLLLRNFQSHKKTKVHFSKGVNVIIGSTDSGKSAIIRALIWIITNRPSGDFFRSWWGGVTKLILKSYEGEVITRTKGSNENSYSVNGVKLNEVGVSVPKEVSETLKIPMGNVQRQLDAPYLISETPGAVSKHFNGISGASSIDIAIHNISKNLRELNSELKVTDSLILEKREALSKYKSLTELEESLIEIEEAENNLSLNASSLVQLKTVTENLSAIRHKKNKAIKFLKLEGLIDKLIGLIEDKDKLITKIAGLNKGILRIHNNRVKRNTLEALLNSEDALNQLKALLQKESDIGKDVRGIKLILSDLSRITKDKSNLSEVINKKIKAYDRDFPDSCPLCNK